MIAIDTSSEEFRALCEAKYVANLPSDARRASFMAGVAEKRGEDAAKALRQAAWAMMRGKKAAA